MHPPVDWYWTADEGILRSQLHPPSPLPLPAFGTPTFAPSNEPIAIAEPRPNNFGCLSNARKVASLTHVDSNFAHIAN